MVSVNFFRKDIGSNSKNNYYKQSITLKQLQFAENVNEASILIIMMVLFQVVMMI